MIAVFRQLISTRSLFYTCTLESLKLFEFLMQAVLFSVAVAVARETFTYTKSELPTSLLAKLCLLWHITLFSRLVELFSVKYTVHRYIHDGKFSVMLSEVLRENCMEACKFAHACCLSVSSITTDTELAWLNPNCEQCCAAIDYADIQKWRFSDRNSFMSSQLNICRFSCFFSNIIRVEYMFSSIKKFLIAVR